MIRDAIRLAGLLIVILLAGTAIASFAEDPAGRPGHVVGCRYVFCDGCTDHLPELYAGERFGPRTRQVGPKLPPPPHSGTTRSRR